MLPMTLRRLPSPRARGPRCVGRFRACVFSHSVRAGNLRAHEVRPEDVQLPEVSRRSAEPQRRAGGTLRLRSCNVPQSLVARRKARRRQSRSNAPYARTIPMCPAQTSPTLFTRRVLAERARVCVLRLGGSPSECSCTPRVLPKRVPVPRNCTTELRVGARGWHL